EQWDETPVLLMTEEERRASEARYPYWPMRDDLGVDFLDHDYIEGIAEMHRYDSLKTMLSNTEQRECIRQLADPEADILVLIFTWALGGPDFATRSLARLIYYGDVHSII